MTLMRNIRNLRVVVVEMLYMKQRHLLPQRPKEAAILEFSEDAYPAYMYIIEGNVLISALDFSQSVDTAYLPALLHHWASNTTNTSAYLPESTLLQPHTE